MPTLIDPKTGRPYDSAGGVGPFSSPLGGGTGNSGSSPPTTPGAAGAGAPGPTGTPPGGAPGPAAPPTVGVGSYNWGGTGRAPTAPMYYPTGTDPTGMIPFQGPDGGGYIDPKTGAITFTTPSKQATGGGLGGAMAQQRPGATATGTATYDPKFDYGLGPQYLGVIPIAHDPNGTPILFYAPTAGGGGKTFTDPTAAAQSVAAWQSWYDSQHPGDKPTTPTGPTDTTGGGGGPGGVGLLMTPGQGEDFFDRTKDFYTRPTNSQKLWDEGMDHQPTEAEQYWQKYAGIFGNPGYLDDYYSRAQQASQTTLDRRASSGGFSDSGAAARATGNLGAVFADKKLQGLQGFATTGMGLAGTADASERAKEKAWLDKVAAAGGVDSTDLAKILGGQTSANSAENQMINRLIGGLDRSIQIGNDIATLTASGMNQAIASQLATQIAALQVQMQAGQLTAAAAYQKSQEYLATLGLIGNSAATAYILSKLGNGNQNLPPLG